MPIVISAQKIAPFKWIVTFDNGESQGIAVKEDRDYTLAEFQIIFNEIFSPTISQTETDRRLRELIREEADRRIFEAISARSREHGLMSLVLFLMYMTKILNKRINLQVLTQREQQIVQQYTSLMNYFEAVKAAARTLETSLDPTYLNNSHWPTPVSVGGIG